MNSTIPKYINVKDRIKADIEAGVIVEKLPGERVLAKTHNVSYMTVRKAVMGLVEEGILRRIATKGTFVNHSRVSPHQTHNIGFFLDDNIVDGISSPYYALIFKMLETEMQTHGYNLVYFSNFCDLNPLKNKKKIDGVIIACFPRIEEKIQTIKKITPIVLLENASSDKTIPSVTIDNFNAMVAVFEYLWSLGHRRIGFITGLQDSNVGQDRLKGYLNALNKHDLKTDKDLIVKGDYCYESGRRGAAKLLALAQPPTAIMCSNDTMALGAMKAIREKGLFVPDDISLTGFDDIDVAAQVYPHLTTIAAPLKEMVRQAMEMLLAALSGENIEYQHRIIPAKLVIRESCSKISI